MVSNAEKAVSTIVSGLVIGTTCALLTYSRDKRKFEPSMIDKVKALDAKWTKDGAELATNLENAKQAAARIAKEKSSSQ